MKGWVTGLEPMISRTTIWRANQLHHTHHQNEPGGIRTLDLRLRRPLLYPAELQTHLSSFRGISLFRLRKRVMGIEPTYPAWKAGVLPLNYTRTSIGVTGFEPATSWSQTRRSSQAEPHPRYVSCSCVSFTSSVTQKQVCIQFKNVNTSKTCIYSKDYSYISSETFILLQYISIESNFHLKYT